MTLTLAAGLFALASSIALPAMAAEGDPARGEKIYTRCEGCHSIERDRVGPRHQGLFGRRAGSVPGFPYSDAMKTSGIVWDAEILDRFLTGPRSLVPGTRMGFAGIPDKQERADLIAYLKRATGE
ncbi:MAG: c-type cytochrome [Rhodospirillales bacterium]